MMKLIQLTFIFILLSSCATNHQTPKTYVFEYTDFGPQAIAHELLGMQWWQWQPHGDSRPAKCDIKVIVYRDIDLDSVEQRYPVVEESLKDYRYVKYDDAITYLNKHIDKNVIEQVTQKLKATRNTLKKN